MDTIFDELCTRKTHSVERLSEELNKFGKVVTDNKMILESVVNSKKSRFLMKIYRLMKKITCREKNMISLHSIKKQKIFKFYLSRLMKQKYKKNYSKLIFSKKTVDNLTMKINSLS